MSDDLVALAIHSPFRKDPFNVNIPPTELVSTIKQHLVSLSQLHQPLSAFVLQFNNEPVSPLVSVQDAGLKSGDALYMVPSKYTFAEAVQHIRQTREILGLKSTVPVLPAVNQGAVAITSFKADAKKKNGKKAKKSAGSDTDPTIPESHAIFSGANPENPRLSSAVAEPNQVAPGPVARSLQLSNWNPVTPMRKLQGHLMYLKFVASDFKTFHITSTVDGFYVSNSTDQKFGPSPKKNDGVEHVSLLRLIGLVSPSTLNAVERTANQLAKQPPLAWIPAKNTMLSVPWVCGKVEEPTGDLALTQIVLNVDLSAETKDWNDELQMSLEMPIIDEEGNYSVRDRILREQLVISTVHGFNKAAVQGVMDIVEGNMLAMNPDEQEGSRIYLRNGIFYYLATDASGAFAELGGNAAARVTAGKDLKNIESILALGIEGICPVLTSVVDYCGRRVVAQAPVPGVFREIDEEQIQYGINEGREKVFAKEDLEACLSKVADFFHLKKHTVYAKTNKADLVTSMDTKVMRGTDGREYLLDLYRLTPPDLSFLDANPDYIHKMALLRPEAVKEWFSEKARPAVTEAGEEGLTQDQISDIIAKYRLNPDVFIDEADIPKEDLEQFRADKEAVLEASALITTKHIPNYIEALVEGKATYPMDGAQLTAGMHARGINMRYLGALHAATGENPLFDNLRSLIQQETVVRATKHYVNRVVSALSPLDAHAKIADIVNQMRSGQPPAELVEEVQRRFRFKLPNDWATQLSRRSFLRELSLQLGLQWSSSVLESKTVQASQLLAVVPKLRSVQHGSSVADEALDTGRQSVAQGDIEPGLEVISEAVSLFDQIYGAVHPAVARAYSAASLAFNEQKDFDRAAEYARSAIAVNERTQGLDACDTLVMYNNLAFFERGRGNLSLALDCTKHFLDLWEQVGFEGHPDTATSLVNVGAMLQEAKLYEQSLEWFNKAIALLEHAYGDNSIHLATPKFQIAQSLLVTGKYKDSARAMEQAHDLFKAKFGAENTNTIECKKWLDYLLSTAVKDQKAAKMRVAAAAQAKLSSQSLRTNGTPVIGKQSASEVLAHINSSEKRKSKKKKSKKH
ncbi:Clustered mitochondria [Wickerhamiella sorbophila]|uniref:Clustered mitochondria n=1 Tax=Wickerhamiella sorbophila TaxID=45607 RepID=A0A2T0FHP0_9ASCO|nr:Clustered mitochondria [Wickerhamiella sorbophila]PRT54486.1 Clustered mitochondria [Wickerhamiella sorbophila]